MDLEFKGIAEIIILLAMLGFFGSLEWRIRSKVSHKTFDAIIRIVTEQNKRLESHIWDIMREMKIQPSMEPPEEIKNNHNRNHSGEASN